MNEYTINRIKSETEKAEGCCLSFAIYKDGKKEFSCWNGDEELPYESHKYEIGSITKTFTGLLTSKAVLEGKISLDDRIDKYIKELDPNKKWPTIKGLVTHTSGIPEDDYSDYTQEELESAAIFFNIDTKERLLQKLNALDLSGEYYPASYSNTGTATMGLILENVYGVSYVDLVRALLKELGLNDTSILEYDDRLLPGIGVKGNLCPHWKWEEQSAYLSAGALVSTPEDMLSYGIHILENKEQAIQNATTVLANCQTTNTLMDICYFWGYFPEYDIYYHTGGTGCFNSSIAIDRKNNAVCVALSNRYLKNDSFTISCLLKMREDS